MERERNKERELEGQRRAGTRKRREKGEEVDRWRGGGIRKGNRRDRRAGTRQRWEKGEEVDRGRGRGGDAGRMGDGD